MMRNRVRTRGFTLVELVVVLGIMAFLLGLTVSASVAVLEKSKHSQTETTLRILIETECFEINRKRAGIQRYKKLVNAEKEPEVGDYGIWYLKKAGKGLLDRRASAHSSWIDQSPSVLKDPRFKVARLRRNNELFIAPFGREN